MIDISELKSRFEQLSIRILSKQGIGSVTLHDVYDLGTRVSVELISEGQYKVTQRRHSVVMTLDEAVEQLTAWHFGAGK